MENTTQTDSKSSSTRFDMLTGATLVGIVFMLAISAVNVWNVKRLGDRVATIEAALSPRRPPGPIPIRFTRSMSRGHKPRGWRPPR